LDRRKVRSSSKRTDHAWRSHCTDSRTTSFNCHECAIGIQHQIILQLVLWLDLLRMTTLFHVTILYFRDVGVRVATRCELLRYRLLGELHVYSACMILNLISQTLAATLDWANISNLELTEANGRIEIEPFGSGSNHVLGTFHLRVHVSDTILLQPKSVLEAAVVEIALCY